MQSANISAPTHTDGGIAASQEKLICSQYQAIDPDQAPPDYAFISAWLGKVGPVGRYKHALYDAGFDSLNSIATLTLEDLIELQVKTGHRRILLNAVEEAKSEIEARKKRYEKDQVSNSHTLARLIETPKSHKKRTGIARVKSFFVGLPGDLAHYAPMFIEGGWDSLEALSLVKEDDLGSIIPGEKKGHRQVVWRGIMELRKRIVDTAVPPTQPKLPFQRQHSSRFPPENHSLPSIHDLGRIEAHDHFDEMDSEDFYRGMSQPRLSPRSRLSRLENFVADLAAPAATKENTKYIYVLSGRDRIPTHQKRHIGEGKYSRWDSYRHTAERYSAQMDVWTTVPIDPCFGAGAACADDDGVIRSMVGMSWSPSKGLFEMAKPSISHDWGNCSAGGGSTIFSFGGFNGKHGISTVVEKYDAKSNTWTSKAPMLTARHSFALARDRNENLLFERGGAGGNQSLGCLKTIERYNPLQDSWARLYDLSSPRIGLQALWNSKTDSLFVLGGSDGAKQKSCDIVEAYDKREGKWRKWAHMQQPRSFFSAIEIPGGSGDIFVCGGKKGSEFQRQCEILDLRANKFRTAAAMQHTRHAVPHPIQGGRRPRGYSVVLA